MPHPDSIPIPAERNSPAPIGKQSGTALLLGVDTCGPSGSVALASLPIGADPEILGQIELEGRSYSATLIASIQKLLERSELALSDLDCLVAVNGPGSFTGVRVGLSAIKGLAEAARIPIVAISRLEVLAAKAGAPSAALDAHRSEIFLRLASPDREPMELLAGREDLATITPAPSTVAVCDDSASSLLAAAWPSAKLIRVSAPSAADAIRLAAARFVAGAFIDPLVLDGHYLRRSDAEIFGDAAHAPARA